MCVATSPDRHLLCNAQKHPEVIEELAPGHGMPPGYLSDKTYIDHMMNTCSPYARREEIVPRKVVRDPDGAVDLGLETLAKVLSKEVPLLVTAHRAHDLASALRVAEEFDVDVVLDGAAEAYLMLPRLAEAGCWVLPHPAMARTRGDLENGSMELAAMLAGAKVPFALQSGFEAYVPKTRVVLWEAGVSVMHGLAHDRALRALTIDAARLCRVDDRLGSLEVGKDADLAVFDGDPLEYTTHCLGVVIDGVRYLGIQR